jgi:hypothetical protein
LFLSALVLFCCTGLPVGTPAKPADSPATAAAAENPSKPAAPPATLPDTPAAKANEAISTDSFTSSTGSIAPGQPFLVSPVKPAGHGGYETTRQRKIWYGLMATSHGAAAFDAWTTRRAISGGYGSEANPLMRPFANSGAIYAATQVSPAIMDYLGHRMMTSENHWMRRLWWLPQAAGTSLSFSAGIHNYRLAP